MKKRMKETSVLMIVAIGIMTVQCGCTAQKAETVGFLSDYSKLEAQSDVSARYLAPDNRLGNYSKFIIDPVVVYLHTDSKAKLAEKDLTEIKNYMHEALVKAIEDRYEVVSRSGLGTARVKVAITDLKKSGIAQNILPISKAVGTGLGGASLEAEVVDSKTKEQIAALVESQLGKRLSLDGYSTWGDAKAIMDGWAKRFRARLDEAHGYK
jgi:hypothetical protein